MTAIEEQILDKLINLEAEVGNLRKELRVKDKDLMFKDEFMRETRLASGTVDTYVILGYIKKMGSLYSYKSWLEYSGVRIERRGRKPKNRIKT